MLQKGILQMCIVLYLSIPVTSQELTMSTALKSYDMDEQIWVNLSLTNTTTLPGAYTFDITFPDDQLSFVTVQPAKEGPFAITPATSATDGKITVAGFQGISTNDTGPVSLATLVFLPVTDQTAVDTSFFTVSDPQVFTTEAQTMNVTLKKRATSVLLPAPAQKRFNGITLTRNYLTFSVTKSGRTTVHLYNLNGQLVAHPLERKHCDAGTHGIPLTSRLNSGIYIARVSGNDFSTTRKLEVVR